MVCLCLYHQGLFKMDNPQKEEYDFTDSQEDCVFRKQFEARYDYRDLAEDEN